MWIPRVGLRMPQNSLRAPRMAFLLWDEVSWNLGYCQAYDDWVWRRLTATSKHHKFQKDGFQPSWGWRKSGMLQHNSSAVQSRGASSRIANMASRICSETIPGVFLSFLMFVWKFLAILSVPLSFLMWLRRGQQGRMVTGLRSNARLSYLLHLKFAPLFPHDVVHKNMHRKCSVNFYHARLQLQSHKQILERNSSCMCLCFQW